MFDRTSCWKIDSCIRLSFLLLAILGFLPSWSIWRSFGWTGLNRAEPGYPIISDSISFSFIFCPFLMSCFSARRVIVRSHRARVLTEERAATAEKPFHVATIDELAEFLASNFKTGSQGITKTLEAHSEACTRFNSPGNLRGELFRSGLNLKGTTWHYISLPCIVSK